MDWGLEGCVEDRDRASVYLCEDRVVQMIDQGLPVRSGTVVLDPEPDHRFTTLAEVSLFCTLTCLELTLPPVQVRHRAGERQSHYSPASGGRAAEIALASWGASRLVVVHELAHHWVALTSPGVAPHGTVFRGREVDLLRHLGLSGTAHALAHAFETAGLGTVGLGTGGRA